VKLSDLKVAIVGLGYVGLPLAVEFGKERDVLGFDINSNRIKELNNGIDSTLEVDSDELKAAKKLSFTDQPSLLEWANFYIVTVPTPVDNFKKPDLIPLTSATKLISKFINKGDIVVYESTVYPGATEEVCVPILEEKTGLKFNEDFFVGYSPERINPGDKEHRLRSIKKVTSGSNLVTANLIDSLYKTIIDAGTYLASSIKVAEASKVIENTQRDLNIALINELAIIFGKLNIDTEEVLEASGTKWNFLPFRPGLVGGHCIGVDPYYLTYKSASIGYNPEIILAGRRMNDGMSSFVVSKLLKAMASKKISIEGSKILILGFTFKENCPDLRNTKVIDVYNELTDFNCQVDIFDPWVDPNDAIEEYQVDIIKTPKTNYYDAVIIAVPHDQFKEMGITKIKEFSKEPSVIFDLKYVFGKSDTDLRL